VRAAIETRVPPGGYDEFTVVTSGGHSGSIYLIGIHSLRMLEERFALWSESVALVTKHVRRHILGDAGAVRKPRHVTPPAADDPDRPRRAGG